KLIRKKAHSDPLQAEKAISAQRQILEDTFICLGLHVDDVEGQKVWNCNEAPLPLLWRGRWRERPILYP
ncbi:MAG TPA: hypothetical protein VFT15_06515, partial [Chitinophagaceae bacterium]|nr:hypothetical protein [Chitinophagaceae bacterium]